MSYGGWVASEIAERILQGFAEFNRTGDLPYDLLDAAVEVRWTEDLPDVETYHGHDGFRRAMEQWLEAWKDFRVEPYEVRQAGDKIAVLFHQTGHGKDSSAQVEMDLGQVYTLRNGRIIRVQEFSDPRRALEALEAETPVERHNADMLHRLVEAAGRKDYQAVLVDLDPEVEIDDTDIPEATGGDSFLEWVARWDEAWESWRIEDLETRAAGDDRAIALFQMVARGKGSSVELTRPDALVAWFRDGKVAKLGYYNDQALALQAAGLSKQPGATA